MSKESHDNDRVQKIDIDDLSNQVAQRIEVIHDKEGKLVQKTGNSEKKKVAVDNIKRK